MATSFLFDGDDTAPVTILLAHGAGASMDSPSMTATAKALAAAGFQVARFEFHYMAARRYGHRKPPPRAETVNPEYVKAIADLRARGVTGKLIIGALNARDYTLLQGLMIIFAICVIIVNTLTDLAYGLVDPRVKYT